MLYSNLPRLVLFFVCAHPGCVFAAARPMTFGVDLTLEGSAGLSGGADRGQTVHGSALAYLDWDLIPADDRPGPLGAYISALSITGTGPTEKFLGDYLAASNAEAYSSTRLYAWWLEGRSGDWTLRAGALLADDEFAGTGVGGSFANSAFGWPAFLSGNVVNTGPAYYVAAPGLRLDHAWSETGAWRLGVYDGDSFDSPEGDPHATRHGLHYEVNSEQGLFVIGEVQLAAPGGRTRGKLGGWLHTAEFADVRDDADGNPYAISGGEPRLHSQNHGAYAILEHTFAGTPGERGNIEGHLRAGFAPDDRSEIAWALDTGLAWTGLIPSREGDVTALGFVHAQFSDRLADHVRLSDPSTPAPEFEQVLELVHAWVVNDHLQLEPHVQFIRQPGGSAALDDALLLMLRINASF